MNKKIYALIPLLILNIIFSRMYAQNLINNGTFDTAASWSFAYKNSPTNPTGSINISGGKLNSYADNNGNSFSALNNNILAVNTTSFNLENGKNYSFSTQIQRVIGSTSYQAAFQWVIINTNGNIVQTITNQYITRSPNPVSGNSTGTLISTSNTTYTSNITFSGTTGNYQLALVWIANQPSGSGSVDDAAFDNVSLQCTIPAITTQPNTSASYTQNSTPQALSVTATAATSYQWYSNTTNSIIGGTLITGATNSMYTPSTAVPGIFYYYVVVTNSCSSVTSSVALITVNSDRDGDGISDNLDLDNDNDGILDTNECYGEKIANGTFTGNANGWTLGGAWLFTGNMVQNSFDNANNDILSQLLAPLSTQSYKLSFRLGSTEYNNTSSAYSASLTIRIGGVIYAVFNNAVGRNNNVTLTLSNGATSDFVPFSSTNTRINTDVNINIPYIYSSTQTNNIEFIVSANGDDWYLDNVSLMGGCDTDGDGIPDYLDLDSDGDNCPDSIEGDGNITLNMLNPNTSISGAVDANGIPVLVNGGQGTGSSNIQTINACICYKPAIPSSAGNPGLISKVGITSLNRAGSTGDNWPAVRTGAWLVLESKTKGFVPNRIAFSGGNPIGINPANFVEGMMVYDTTNKCMKIYTSTNGGSTFAWSCINTQTCPDL